MSEYDDEPQGCCAHFCLCCCNYRVGHKKLDDDGYNSDDEKGPQDPKAGRPNFEVEKGKTISYDSQYTRVRKVGRRPTDILCLIVFPLFVVLMVGIGVYGF